MSPPPVPGLRAAGWMETALPHAFLGRDGGVSGGGFASLNLSSVIGDEPEAVRANWERVGQNLGARRGIGRMSQVHGARIATLGPDELDAGEADGLMTAVPGLALAVLTADCVPILFAAPRQKVVGVAHAGWRGTLAGIAGVMVDRFRQEFGVPPAELKVALGPSIDGCCYEVEEDLAGRFVTAGWIDGGIRPTPGRKPRLDLREVNCRILRAAGVPEGAVERVGPCTSCASTAYFSHRAHQGRTGRQGSLVICPE